MMVILIQGKEENMPNFIKTAGSSNSFRKLKPQLLLAFTLAKFKKEMNDK